MAVVLEVEGGAGGAGVQRFGGQEGDAGEHHFAQDAAVHPFLEAGFLVREARAYVFEGDGAGFRGLEAADRDPVRGSHFSRL